ncbi:MAG: redox-active protein [Bacteroidia bacterium]|nr:MAG: redox-active protein [Bacteroidia bacterium]
MHKKQKKSELAVHFFHKKPYNYNCAQAVVKACQQDFNISDDEIENYRQCGGGRAENNYCGAFYAGLQLLKNRPEQQHLFAEKFTTIATTGVCTRREHNRKLSCVELVELAGSLIEEVMEDK